MTSIGRNGTICGVETYVTLVHIIIICVEFYCVSARMWFKINSKSRIILNLSVLHGRGQNYIVWWVYAPDSEILFLSWNSYQHTPPGNDSRRVNSICVVRNNSRIKWQNLTKASTKMMKCLKGGGGAVDLGMRRVKIEAAQSSDLASLPNAISTTKYNLATFLPKFLFEQFRK